MYNLDTLGGTDSYGYAINEVGEVTGEAFLADGSYHAFVYSDGVMIDLGTLGGLNSYGIAINDSGQVAGDSDTSDGGTMYFSPLPSLCCTRRLLASVTRRWFGQESCEQGDACTDLLRRGRRTGNMRCPFRFCVHGAKLGRRKEAKALAHTCLKTDCRREGDSGGGRLQLTDTPSTQDPASAGSLFPHQPVQVAEGRNGVIHAPDRAALHGVGHHALRLRSPRSRNPGAGPGL